MEIEALIKKTYQFLKSPRGKKATFYTGCGIAVFIVICLVVPFFYSYGYLKQNLRIALEERIHSSVNIAGDVKLRLLPWPGIDAKDIIISHAPEVRSTEKLATIHKLRVDFALFSLLSGNIVPSNAELIGADINLMSNDHGNISWAMDRITGKRTIQQSNKKFNSYEFALYLLKALPYRQLPYEFSLKDSQVSFFSPEGPVQITNVNNTIRFDHADNGVHIKGHGLLNNDGIDWFVSASNIRAFTSKERSSLKISYASNSFNFGLTGNIERDVYRGRGSISIVSLRNIIPELLEYSPLNALVTPLEFNLNANQMECGRSYCNMKGTFQLDRVAGRIDAQTQYGGPVPELRISMKVQGANLAPFFANKLPESLKLSSEIARDEKNISWSKTPIDLSLLRLAKTRVELKIGQLSFGKIVLGKGILTMIANENGMEFNITDTEMYSGRGTVNLSADYKHSPIKWTGMFNLSNVDLNPITHIFMDIRSLQGRNNLLMNVTAQGDTPHAIISSANGNGILYSQSSRIRGIDMSAMFRNLPFAFKPELMPRHNTEFDTLNANFKINNGVFSNDDLKVSSRFMQFTGKGKIDFVNYLIDYQFMPQLVIRLDHTAGTGNRTIYPIQVKGPLKAPSFTLNLNTPIQNNPNFKDENPVKKKPKAR